MIGLGPKLAIPAFGLGVEQSRKIWAVGDLKRSRTNRAAGVQTPVSLLTWDHFAAIFRMSQEAGSPECLAMKNADHKNDYKHLPLRDEYKVLAVGI